MQWSRSLTAAACVALTAAWACSKPEAPEADPVDPGVVAAYGQFVETRRTRPIDFQALTGLYQTRLAPYIRRAADRFGCDLDPAIRAALEQGREGRNPAVVAQIADKTIQRAFILTFTQSLKRLRETVEDDESLRLVREAEPVIRSTADRRSQWAGKGSEYPDLLDRIMGRLVAGAGRRNIEAVAEAGAQLESLVTKVLVLSVFYELYGLEKAREWDEDKAGEKRIEAQIYHLDLTGAHLERNREGAHIVADQLAGPTDWVDIDLVRKLLKTDFSEEISDVDPTILGLAAQ
ncbi:hypothetical protein ACFL4G_04995 [Thermodesulfobacteriota bacterium]